MLSVFQDHSKRFSPLKAATLLYALLPAAWLVVRWQTGTLGGRPIIEAIHVMGDWTIRFLLLTLAVTPARVVLDWQRVLLLRRMLGVTAAFYATGHLLLYCLDQKWNPWVVIVEIVSRFYLTIGFVALSGLIVLGITSTNGWQRRLRQNWKKLHKLVFPIAVLGFVHYFLQSKVDVTNAVLFTGMFLWLALWRLAPRTWRNRPWFAATLAPTAALLTAAVEFAWYALATKANAVNVLLGNLDISYSLRPAVQILALGLLLGAASSLRLGRWRMVWKRRQA